MRSWYGELRNGRQSLIESTLGHCQLCRQAPHPCLPLLASPGLSLASHWFSLCLPLASPVLSSCLPFAPPLPLRPSCLPLPSLAPPCFPAASPPLAFPLPAFCLPFASLLHSPCSPLAFPLHPSCLPLLSPCRQASIWLLAQSTENVVLANTCNHR